jgi:hypothetical protein
MKIKVPFTLSFSVAMVRRGTGCHGKSAFHSVPFSAGNIPARHNWALMMVLSRSELWA